MVSMDNITKRIAGYSMAWEGCFSMSHAHKHKDGRYYDVIIPSVSIAGTSKELLDSFQILTGYGKVYPEKRLRRLTNQKVVWCWRLRNCNEISSFCFEILDYLPIKGEQAQLLYEYCNGRTTGSRYTNRDFEILSKVQFLNKRGIED